ncbi:MAG: Uma2 family endonuclease [Deltaproteobacteria bacterium]|nr:Uma2 family endonuclease [Deltaproteobacteria bacterium]
MGDAAEQTWIDYATYLTVEAQADRKHEWLDGVVYAMAGGTLEHGQLSAAVIGELRGLASGCGCRVFSSDAKVRVSATGLATYPDASVVCGPIERDADDRNAMANPAVLVEVLSDGTEAYDRGEKFEHYRRLPSLRDYVLVSQRRPLVEVYSRDAHDRWVLTAVGAGERFTLSALPGDVEVDRVYAGVELVAAPPRSVRG